jgi:hypothetical protein
MFYLVFFGMLFLPVALRLMQTLMFGLQLRTHREALFFVVPLVLVLIWLCIVAIEMGAYGLFIPLMLITFWGPQLVFIIFFGWCDREDLRLDSSKVDTTSTKKQKGN